jgi:glutamate racemase
VKDGVDVIVLGCTHYPFVADVIREFAGDEIRILDSGNAVARRAREVLMQTGLLNGVGSEPTLLVHTSADPAVVQPIVERMLGRPIEMTNLDLRQLATAN